MNATTTHTERRALSFTSLAEVMPEVDRLLQGHRTVGNWSLGQICNHLAGSFIYSLEGFPAKLPWLIRKAIGPLAKRDVFGKGRMREGIKLPEKFLPGPDSTRAEAEALRGALSVYAAHAGPLADHPMFGPLDHNEWTSLHCIHCAHHLSFVQPGV